MRIKLLPTVVLAALTLPACGQKGPLVLPSRHPAEPAAATQAAPAPAAAPGTPVASAVDPSGTARQ
jgi:predicted small lipoprotein YifL